MNATTSGDALDNRLREPLADVFGRVAAPWAGVTDHFLHSAPGQALAEFVDGRVRAGAAVYPREVLLEIGAERCACCGGLLWVIEEHPARGDRDGMQALELCACAHDLSVRL